MKKIRIKIAINNCLYNNIFIKILKNNKIVSQGNTDSLGNYYFCGNNEAYKIIINNTYTASFLITDNSPNTYLFCFNSKVSNRRITLYLTDANYEKLKIERGIINLWPNLIQ